VLVRPYGRRAGELFHRYECDGFFDDAFEGDGSIRPTRSLLKSDCATPRSATVAITTTFHPP